jgi:hypothetical protein
MVELTLEQKLQKPFPPDDIEWRIQSSGIDRNGKPWALIMPYVTNRAIQERLDEVFGVFGWQNEYKPVTNERGLSFLCGLAVTDEAGNKITKWDGADETNFENFKGGLSNSMKRAGVQFGIGRYLYKLDTYFADLSEDKHRGTNMVKIEKKRFYYNAPKLPAFALPEHFVYHPIPNATTMDAYEETLEKTLEARNITEEASKCETLDELKKWFHSFSTVEQKQIEGVKNDRKAEIEKASQHTLESLRVLTLPKLYDVCKDLDLMGYTKKSKADVINLILKHINK